MSPEQLRGQPIDRQTDVYAASVCLWETLTRDASSSRGTTRAASSSKSSTARLSAPSRCVPTVPHALDAPRHARARTRQDQALRHGARVCASRSSEPFIRRSRPTSATGSRRSRASAPPARRADRRDRERHRQRPRPGPHGGDVRARMGRAPAVAPSSGMIGGVSSQVSSISVAASDRAATLGP